MFDYGFVRSFIVIEYLYSATLLDLEDTASVIDNVPDLSQVEGY